VLLRLLACRGARAWLVAVDSGAGTQQLQQQRHEVQVLQLLEAVADDLVLQRSHGTQARVGVAAAQRSRVQHGVATRHHAALTARRVRHGHALGEWGKPSSSSSGRWAPAGPRTHPCEAQGRASGWR
jgi:hypothetical protein